VRGHQRLACSVCACCLCCCRAASSCHLFVLALPWWCGRDLGPQANVGSMPKPAGAKHDDAAPKNKALIKSAVAHHCSTLLCGKRAWACNTPSTINGSQNVHHSCIVPPCFCLRGQLRTWSRCLLLLLLRDE